MRRTVISEECLVDDDSGGSCEQSESLHSVEDKTRRHPELAPQIGGSKSICALISKTTSRVCPLENQHKNEIRKTTIPKCQKDPYPHKQAGC
jgi:hypothetical protein